jgi:hypothetical protein
MQGEVELFKLVEEAIQIDAEDKRILAVAPGRDIRPLIVLVGLVNGIAVVSLVGPQGRAQLRVGQQLLGRGAVMILA